MSVHFESRAAAEAHLFFQNFRQMTRKGHTHKWRCMTPGMDKVRAVVQTIEGTDTVMLGCWEV